MRRQSHSPHPQNNWLNQRPGGRKRAFGQGKAMPHWYDADSSDEDRSMASYKRRSKSVGAVPKASLGSDTCTFETMTETAADELMLSVAASKHSAKAMETATMPKGRITYPMDNLGNTCFFNSVMQCLTHTLPFHALCLSKHHAIQC